LNQIRYFVLAMIMGAVVAPLASAQTVASVSVVSGNGQLICEGCVNSAFQFFDNVTVQVTDATNNPIVGQSVSWTVASGLATLGTTTSITDVNGLAYASVFPTQQYGSLSFTYSQNTIVATAGAFSATFILSQALPNYVNNTNAVPPVTYDFSALANLFGNTVTGTASSPASFSAGITAGVESTTGGGIPNISLRLVNADNTSGPSLTIPSIYCPTAAGADPYSVLTASDGYATCAAVFGGVPGVNGTFSVLLGGIAKNNNYSTWTSQYAGDLPVGVQSNIVKMAVSPAVVGSVAVASGNNQVANPGKALGSQLMVTVSGPSGSALAGQVVNWTVSPTTAGSFSSASSTTGSNGQASDTFTIAASYLGAFTITAAAASNSTVVARFTENSTAPITVTGITIVSGNGQYALAGAAFPNPLVVQVNSSTGAPAVNSAVTFTATGVASTLSTTSATTNSSGQAQVSVTAGATLGNITVTATASTYSVTFTLAVISAAPVFTAANFYNGADFQRGSVSPCGIASLIAGGIAPAIQGTVAASDIGALPYSLGGDSLTINGAQAPIYSVSNNSNGTQQLNFQLPCSVAAGSTIPVTVTVGSVTGTASLTVLPASPGVFQDALSNGTSIAVIERPDGSFMSSSNPARAGETVTAFVTGLGATSPSVGTDALPIPGNAVTPTGSIIVGVNNAGAPLVSARLSTDLIGVFEVTFQIPSSLASTTGSPNVVPFSIGVTVANGSCTATSSTCYSVGTNLLIQ
jgi:uncharacterized protein (TIGR03437 family)